MIASEEEDEGASEEDRPSPVDEDTHIDPELRSEGHVVGEGRARSMTRRAGGGSPYPSQSPRYPQGSLPVAGQDTGAPGQPHVRFGQPSLDLSSFPTYPHIRPMSVAPSSFAAMSSSPMTMTPTTSTVARPQLHGDYDRTAQIPQLPPRPGVDYVVDSGGLPAARRVNTYPETQEQSQGEPMRPSSGSSSSGSSRTWNNTR